MLCLVSQSLSVSPASSSLTSCTVLSGFCDRDECQMLSAYDIDE